jgi:prepilin peptidase CpaA
MFGLIIFLTAVFVALGAGAYAAISDIRGLTIPNSHSFVVMCAFILGFIFLSLLGQADVFKPLMSHLIAGVIVLGITAFLFALRAIGAADSKLASVYALWFGVGGLPAFLFYTTVAGGVLALVAIVMGRLKLFKNPKPGGWIARVQTGENKVPYGVAIAGGALASFIKLGYLSPETLSAFLAL